MFLNEPHPHLFLQAVEHSLQLTLYQGCIIIIISENLLFSHQPIKWQNFPVPSRSLFESRSILSRITSGPGDEVGLKEDVGSGNDTVSILTESNLPPDGISRTKLIKDNVYVPLHEKWKGIV